MVNPGEQSVTTISSAFKELQNSKNFSSLRMFLGSYYTHISVQTLQGGLKLSLKLKQIIIPSYSQNPFCLSKLQYLYLTTVRCTIGQESYPYYQLFSTEEIKAADRPGRQSSHHINWKLIKSVCRHQESSVGLYSTAHCYHIPRTWNH